ncbi:outer membrane beta-barrel protein [Zhongshania aliphaticivorans]|uniref:outer membrane beta-barrel protein n=1 Tax=Zhongshania aliphaticivorans TaxID=1470434 RepID=UPI0012E3FCDD|nr:outer membrane beta-barrel protein [Zhongshania aliphaticivorans]CAA0117948.1 Uncharacterised protein [Zhongshania aliphaticivorans]
MKKVKVMIAAGVLAAYSTASYAEQGAGYLIAQVLLADYDVSENEMRSILDDGSLSSFAYDNEGEGFAFGLGYRFSNNFAVEGGYIDLGEVSGDGNSDGTVFYAPGKVESSIETDGIFAGFLFSQALSPGFSLTARLGFLSWDSEFSISDSVDGGSGNDDGRDVYFGFGAAFNASSAFQITATFDRYQLDDVDVDVIGLGAKMYFQ